MRTSLRLFAVFSAISAAACAAFAVEDAAKPGPAPVDVSGTWDFAVQTEAGGGNPVFTFKQDGEKLTGTYRGYFGEAPVAGTLAGHAIAFRFKTNLEGQEVTIEYSGTVEGPTMKGKLNFGSYGEGTFTAKRRAE